MHTGLAEDHRPYIWAAIIVASLGLWLMFGSTKPNAIVSGWNGDPLAVQKVAAAEQSISLSAPFNRQAHQALPGVPLAELQYPQNVPWGNPTDSSDAVMTQGYDVGTHAPAAVWGGIDIAIDSNGDGQPNPEASMNSPLYATMSGVIELRPDSVPAGNHLWIKNDRYKVGYAHLQSFTVKAGQVVKRGDLIGYMGSTGQSTGPHLHYHIWEDGVNVNPLNFGALP
jgi:murein DD-endopeptidase MepM/ murein hydrolase activator NlpD